MVPNCSIEHAGRKGVKEWLETRYTSSYDTDTQGALCDNFAVGNGKGEVGIAVRTGDIVETYDGSDNSPSFRTRWLEHNDRNWNERNEAHTRYGMRMPQ